MSVYLSIDGAPGDLLASNKGWGDVCRWIDSLDDEVYHELIVLREYGWSQELDELRHELSGAMKGDNAPKDKTVISTLQNLVKFLGEEGEVATVNDGMGPDEEAKPATKKWRKDFAETDHPRDDHGRFGSGGASSAPTESSSHHAQAAATLAKPSIATKLASLPAAVAAKAVGKAKVLYGKMEKRYGPRWAKAIVITAIVTMPTPVTMLSVAVMTGLAHLFSHGPAKSEGADMSQDEIDAAARELIEELERRLADDVE